jgi:hypothetical protein
MTRSRTAVIALTASLLASVGNGSEQGNSRFHDDYYEGFAQGAYYGLMLAGESYEIAWCMKGELQYESRGMGSGADFQRRMESLLETCRREFGAP